MWIPSASANLPKGRDAKPEGSTVRENAHHDSRLRIYPGAERPPTELSVLLCERGSFLLGGDAMRQTLAAFCVSCGREELLRQWDEVRNAPLTPEAVAPGSHRLVWWTCPKGHRYHAAVRSRSQGSGCPYCAGKAVLAEETSLAARYPRLADEWDGEKNGALTPQQVSSGSRRKVWWRCGNGHAWLASVASRAQNGSGCPVCAGKIVLAGENDLASRYPDLAREWDDDKNGGLSPRGVTPGSNRAVWWRCEKGHSYQAPVARRTQYGTGCPYCANAKVLPGFNDLKTRCPALAAQWHPSLNGPLTPEDVTSGSHRRVWWQCPCGHVWKAAVYARSGGKQSGCPVCAGKTRQASVTQPRGAAENDRDTRRKL